MPAAAGKRLLARCSHSKYSHGEYWHTKKAPKRDPDILQVATGRQLLEEGDALLHGLRRHGVLRAASNETLLVVYGPQHTMRYVTQWHVSQSISASRLFLLSLHCLHQRLLLHLHHHPFSTSTTTSSTSSSYSSSYSSSSYYYYYDYSYKYYHYYYWQVPHAAARVCPRQRARRLPLP
jgi:hypothetical protein